MSKRRMHEEIGTMLDSPAADSAPRGTMRNTRPVYGPARSTGEKPTEKPSEEPSEEPIELFEGEKEELQRSVTMHSARVSRDADHSNVWRALSRRRRARVRLIEVLLVLDVVLALGSLWLVRENVALIAGVLHVAVASLSPATEDMLLLTAFVAVVWPTVFSLMGLYRNTWVADSYSVVRAMLGVAFSGLIVGGLSYAIALEHPRELLFCFLVLDAVLVIVVRLVSRLLVRVPRRVLIVGTGRLALDVARWVSAHKRYGLNLIGIVGPAREYHPEPETPESWHTNLYQQWVDWRLGGTHDTAHMVRMCSIDLVLVALSPQERDDTSTVISSLAHLPVQVYVVPDVTLETAKASVDTIDGLPVIGLTESAISGWTARVKRLMDLAICIPALIIAAPIMAVIAVLIRLDSRGPAIFKQERVGQHNRLFTIYKFRTMVDGADKQAQKVAAQTNDGLVHKRRGDPRITRIGSFLRRTSLDELPQLYNVLKGDMSMVGPRPELPWIAARYRAWQYRRLLVPQGLTGWWQVNGRSNRVLHLHTQDDIFYVRNYSLWLDIKILVKTVKVVLLGRGAY